MKTLDALYSLSLRTDAPGLVPAFDARPAIIARLFRGLPLEIPGSTAGAVAINSVANTLLSYGATPRYLAMSFTLAGSVTEEQVKALAESCRQAAVMAEAEIVSVAAATDDDISPAIPVSISVTGIGQENAGTDWHRSCARPGDKVLLTAPVGAHGAAMAATRLAGAFLPPVVTDSASLGDPVHTLMRVVPEAVRMIAAPQFGLRRTLRQIQDDSGVSISLDTDAVPVDKAVRAVAKIMGTDPLDMETEGALVVIVAPDKAEKALDALRRSPLSARAALIATVTP